MGLLGYEFEYDVLIIGVGFFGISCIYYFCKFFLLWCIKVVEVVDEVGGIWYFNCYFGVCFDLELVLYYLLWDKEYF